MYPPAAGAMRSGGTDADVLGMQGRVSWAGDADKTAASAIIPASCTIEHAPARARLCPHTVVNLVSAAAFGGIHRAVGDHDELVNGA